MSPYVISISYKDLRVSTLSHAWQYMSIILDSGEAETGGSQAQCLTGVQSEINTSLGNLVSSFLEIAQRTKTRNGHIKSNRAKIRAKLANWKVIFPVSIFTKNMTTTSWDENDMTYFRNVEFFLPTLSWGDTNKLALFPHSLPTNGRP